MSASDRLERMMRLAEEREARGELVATPEQVRAQEEARYSEVDRCKWKPPTGELEPVRSHKLKHQKPYDPFKYAKKRAGHAAQKEKKAAKKLKGHAPKLSKADRHFLNLREQVIAERGMKCEECGRKTPSVLLRRLHWRKKGREEPQDVVLKCPSCVDTENASRRPDDCPLSREYQRIVKG